MSDFSNFAEMLSKANYVITTDWLRGSDNSPVSCVSIYDRVGGKDVKLSFFFRQSGDFLKMEIKDGI